MLPWFLAAAAVYVAVVFAFWLGQDRLIYYPGPKPGPPPAAETLELREEWIETNDGERLHAWLATPRRAGRAGETKLAGGVLVCHGNAGNIASRLPVAAAFCEWGFATLLFDYRGYGSSSGKPSEEGTYRDAEAAFDKLASLLDASNPRIVAYGESLGGAVAIELAFRRKVACVVVEDTFTSLVEMASGLYPWLPVSAFLRQRYDSIAKVGAFPTPLLVAHSPEDDLVPFALGKRLFEAAREPKTFLETGGRHNEGGFLDDERWKDAVRSFLDTAP